MAETSARKWLRKNINYFIAIVVADSVVLPYFVCLDRDAGLRIDTMQGIEVDRLSYPLLLVEGPK